MHGLDVVSKRDGITFARNDEGRKQENHKLDVIKRKYGLTIMGNDELRKQNDEKRTQQKHRLTIEGMGLDNEGKRISNAGDQQDIDIKQEQRPGKLTIVNEGARKARSDADSASIKASSDALDYANKVQTNESAVTDALNEFEFKEQERLNTIRKQEQDFQETEKDRFNKDRAADDKHLLDRQKYEQAGRDAAETVVTDDSYPGHLEALMLGSGVPRERIIDENGEWPEGFGRMVDDLRSTGLREGVVPSVEQVMASAEFNKITAGMTADQKTALADEVSKGIESVLDAANSGVKEDAPEARKKAIHEAYQSHVDVSMDNPDKRKESVKKAFETPAIRQNAMKLSIKNRLDEMRHAGELGSKAVQKAHKILGTRNLKEGLENASTEQVFEIWRQPEPRAVAYFSSQGKYGPEVSMCIKQTSQYAEQF